MFNRRDVMKSASAAAAAFTSDQDKRRNGEITAPVYAIVELMGHKRLCGRLQQSPTPNLLQLDVPIECGYITKLINTASVYAVTIVDESTVRELAQHVDSLPAIELEDSPRAEGLPPADC